MKMIQTICSLVSIFFAVQAAADYLPTTVPVNFSKIYVPDGFDNNDNIQIVGEGIFSNSCYRNAETKVQVDQVKKTIRVSPVAYKYDGICLQVILPFDRVLNLGILKDGKYTIIQDTDNQTLGQLSVRIAMTENADDYLYAPVSQAYFQSHNSVNKVFLTGNFPLSCMKMKEVKSEAQANVLLIQPIIEVDSSVPCTSGQFPFETVTDVGAMKPGHYLLHIRSMNGKSVNNFIDVH